MSVKINGNRGTQQEFSVSPKVSKEIVPFQQEFPVQECDVRNDPTGHVRPPVLLGIRLRNPDVNTQ